MTNSRLGVDPGNTTLHLGVDLGGTNLTVGLVTSSGEVLARLSCPTRADSRSYSKIVADIIDLCYQVITVSHIDFAQITSLGVGVPGTVDRHHGQVIYANNLPVENFPLRDTLAVAFPGLSISLDNDANVAALGEYRLWLNRYPDKPTPTSFLLLTLGTGIGGGLILNGDVYRGFNDAGLEVGHFTFVHDGLPCTCGKKGCFEQYASVTALINQTKQTLLAHPDSAFALAHPDHSQITGKTAFASSDPLAEKIVATYLNYLADGVTSLINIFQPEILLLSGGISREGDRLLHPVRDFATRFSYDRDLPRTSIEIASAQNDAGLIGAALQSVA